MKLADLISLVRQQGHDVDIPYFWSDADITGWLNEAVTEAAIRGRLLHEDADPEICHIDVTAGQARYVLHPLVYEITYIAFQADGHARTHPLVLKSTEAMDDIDAGWRDRPQGMPKYAGQSDTRIRLVPTPRYDGVVRIEAYRLPATPLDVEHLDDEPEIHAAHHVHLVQWALHRGFRIPDMESFDPDRAAASEEEFTRYFGARPDADMRRITREDVPHHVEAFWP